MTAASLRLTAHPRRVCAVRLGGMGDILHTTPTLRALAERFPGVQIDYIVNPRFADALTGLPTIRRVITFDKSGGDMRVSRFLPFLRGLHRERYDLFLNFQRSAKTILMALASGAPRVITYRRDTGDDPATGRQVHAVENFALTLAPLGIRHLADRHLDFFVPDAARERVLALLADEDIGPDDPLVVLNPGASHEVNRWPPAQIGALFDVLADELPQVRLALCGGPGADVAMAKAALEHTRRARVALLAGRTSVKELGALLARAQVMVTGDTGPMHIAAAVGTPVVALFGPADPDRTGPVGAKHLVVVNRDGLDCVPCRSRVCRRGDNACMVNLSAFRVADAVRRQLEACALPPARGPLSPNTGGTGVRTPAPAGAGIPAGGTPPASTPPLVPPVLGARGPLAGGA